MKLSICPTPIGNLRDITLRVLDTLNEADVIAAEDSRHTRKLLTHYDIKTRLIRYDDHHSQAGLETVMDLLRSGKHVALVSDAGMPVISGPGIPLIRQCLVEGIEVDVLPGATAFVNALVLSGLAADSFTFYGFLPRKQSELRRKLAEIKPRKEVFIIYEAPHRIVKTLTELKALLGNRQVVLARELTKMHEEVLRMDIASLMEELTLHPRKGEMVLLVSGAPEEEISTTIEQELISLLELGMSKNDAIKAVAQSRHVAKREVYQVAMKLK